MPCPAHPAGPARPVSPGPGRVLNLGSLRREQGSQRATLLEVRGYVRTLSNSLCHSRAPFDTISACPLFGSAATKGRRTSGDGGKCENVIPCSRHEWIPRPGPRRSRCARLRTARWATDIGSVPTASFTVTKLRWLADHEPVGAKAAETVLRTHDWLTWRLRSGEGGARAGHAVTDRPDAAGTRYLSAAEGSREFAQLSAAEGSREFAHLARRPSATGAPDWRG